MEIFLSKGLDLHLMDTRGNGGGTYYKDTDITEVWADVEQLKTKYIPSESIIDLFLPTPLCKVDADIHNNLINIINGLEQFKINDNVLGYWKGLNEDITVYTFKLNYELSKEMDILLEELKLLLEQEAMAVKVNEVPYLY